MGWQSSQLHQKQNPPLSYKAERCSFTISFKHLVTFSLRETKLHTRILIKSDFWIYIPDRKSEEFCASKLSVAQFC